MSHHGAKSKYRTGDISPDDIRLEVMRRENKKLHNAIRETIEDNPRLADGDNCALIKLKRVISKTDDLATLDK